MLSIGKAITKEIRSNDISLDDNIGTYSRGKVEFAITKNKDHLVINLQTGGHFELVPIEGNKFILRGVSPECTVKFLKDKTGQVTEMISVQKGKFNWVKLENTEDAKAKENVEFESYSGKYQLLTMQGAFTTISVENGHLMAETTTGLTKAELIHIAENKFKYNDPKIDLQFEFIKGKKGKINKIVVTQAGEMHSKKIK